MMYAVRAISWDLAKVEKYWDNISAFGIFSDNMPKNALGFLNLVMQSDAIWFEVVDITYEDEKVVGMIYLTHMITGSTSPFIQADWHAMVWDAKAGTRRPVFKAAIQALFQQFGFHRLRAEIPLKFGGVIRQAKKLGFVEEGVMREAVLYDGVWFNTLSMSILEKEALAWEIS